MAEDETGVTDYENDEEPLVTEYLVVDPRTTAGRYEPVPPDPQGGILF